VEGKPLEFVNQVGRRRLIDIEFNGSIADHSLFNLLRLSLGLLFRGALLLLLVFLNLLGRVGHS